jgi:hypothetical protein
MDCSKLRCHNYVLRRDLPVLGRWKAQRLRSAFAGPFHHDSLYRIHRGSWKASKASTHRCRLPEHLPKTYRSTAPPRANKMRHFTARAGCLPLAPCSPSVARWVRISLPHFWGGFHDILLKDESAGAVAPSNKPLIPAFCSPAQAKSASFCKQNVYTRKHSALRKPPRIRSKALNLLKKSPDPCARSWYFWRCRGF